MYMFYDKVFTVQLRACFTGVIWAGEVDETDDDTLSVECINSPRSRLVTAPAAECFRVLPSSAEVDDVLWAARYRHRTIATLRRH